MDDLEALISLGPEPSYKVKAAILQRYPDILKARQLMRRWSDITMALGFEVRQWRQVAAVFRRVDAGVKSGKLLPGKAINSGNSKGAAPVVNYGGFDKPKPKHVFDDDQQGEAK